MKFRRTLTAGYFPHSEGPTKDSKVLRLPESDPSFGMDTLSLRRQDLLCLSLYYLGFSRIRNLAFRCFRKPVARILAFHDVPDSLVTNFRVQIEVLKEEANIIGLDDLLAGKISWKKINVAITFDDGYRSWVDYVSPVLRDLGVTATFFVSSGLVIRRGKQETGFLRNDPKSRRQTGGCLSSVGLKKLVEDGFEIGGHTSNHVNLAEICDRNVLRSEIQKDKKKLETITGTTVKYFAYPFGFFRNAHIDLAQVLQEAGYRGAVTTVPGFNTLNTNRYLLHRDLVKASMPMPLFRARLRGNHDGVTWIRKLLRIQPGPPIFHNSGSVY